MEDIDVIGSALLELIRVYYVKFFILVWNIQLCRCFPFWRSGALESTAWCLDRYSGFYDLACRSDDIFVLLFDWIRRQFLWLFDL